MKKLGIAVAMLVVMALGFAGGIWVVKRGGGAAAAPKKAGRKILYWVDPMHPAYKSDKPGKAPDCGMDLEPVYEKAMEMPGPEGTIHVATDKQQLIGVTYATVEPASMSETIRANGRVMQDETRITRVHTKIEGWIDKVYVDFAGQFVKAGDPLITIYSPEMLATQKELLLALKARESLKAGPSHEAMANSETLIEAARRRLELWDLGPKEIRRIEETGQPVRTVTIYSPAAGYVMTRNAYASQKVMPETELYAIADLSRVWVVADVFEGDMAKVRAGQTATIAQPWAGGRRVQARVAYIQPQMDPATRTLKVRLEAANPTLKLKPEMYVDVEFQSGVSGRMTVPADAVVNTGLRKTVFVDRGEGHLEPRAVETGERIGERVEIVRGVKPGERVVASGAFLIDSEAQLKEGVGEHHHD